MSLKDAAKHLSLAFGDDIKESDVLQFALDRKLRLSICFAKELYGCPCLRYQSSGRELSERPIPKLKSTFVVYRGEKYILDGGGEVLEIKNEIKELESGIWDLPMIGGESIDIEYASQQLITGIQRTAHSMAGVFIASDTGEWFMLQSAHPNDCIARELDLHKFRNATRLPSRGVFVVRASALRELELTVNGETERKDKTLSTAERNTLLKLVIGMAINGYGYVPATSRSTAPKEIADDLAALGMPITDDTVRKYLKLAQETVLPTKPRQS